MNKTLIIANLSYGSIRLGSPVSCEKAYQIIENIIEISSYFENCFIINDEHSPKDGEFRYIPPHMLKFSGDISRMIHLEKRLKSKYIQYLTKDTLSAFRTIHNIETILFNKPNEICISGFSATIDIIPTVLDIIQENIIAKLLIISDAIGDISEEYKNKAIEYISFLGIPVYNKDYYVRKCG